MFLVAVMNSTILLMNLFLGHVVIVAVNMIILCVWGVRVCVCVCGWVVGGGGGVGLVGWWWGCVGAGGGGGGWVGVGGWVWPMLRKKLALNAEVGKRVISRFYPRGNALSRRLHVPI